jgi:hypothetical protein
LMMFIATNKQTNPKTPQMATWKLWARMVACWNPTTMLNVYWSGCEL